MSTPYIVVAHRGSGHTHVTEHKSKKEAHEYGMNLRSRGIDAYAHSKEDAEKFGLDPRKSKDLSKIKTSAVASRLTTAAEKATDHANTTGEDSDHLKARDLHAAARDAHASGGGTREDADYHHEMARRHEKVTKPKPEKIAPRGPSIMDKSGPTATYAQRAEHATQYANQQGTKQAHMEAVHAHSTARDYSVHHEGSKQTQYHTDMIRAHREVASIPEIRGPRGGMYRVVNGKKVYSK